MFARVCIAQVTLCNWLERIGSVTVSVFIACESHAKLRTTLCAKSWYIALMSISALFFAAENLEMTVLKPAPHAWLEGPGWPS